jgi:endonuclease/exonuclease/phosphatase family metal-dependent hydrolase
MVFAQVHMKGSQAPWIFGSVYIPNEPQARQQALGHFVFSVGPFQKRFGRKTPIVLMGDFNMPP